jgi:hypothetical protein
MLAYELSWRPSSTIDGATSSAGCAAWLLWSVGKIVWPSCAAWLLWSVGNLKETWIDA